jgi:hypothetical protein
MNKEYHCMMRYFQVPLQYDEGKAHQSCSAAQGWALRYTSASLGSKAKCQLPKELQVSASSNDVKTPT